MVTKENQIGKRNQLDSLSANKELHIEDFHNDPVRLLEHIAVCDSCENIYTNYIEQHALIKAPMDLKKNILREIEKHERKSIWERIFGKHYSYRLKFLGYSMNVGLAMCGAILFLFLIPINSFPNQSNITYKNLYEKNSAFLFFHKVNDNLKDVSDSMVNYTDDLINDNFSIKGGNK